jgi:hypothetical protein
MRAIAAFLDRAAFVGSHFIPGAPSRENQTLLCQPKPHECCDRARSTDREVRWRASDVADLRVRRVVQLDRVKESHWS